jgi:hypothetical protein
MFSLSHVSAVFELALALAGTGGGAPLLPKSEG